MQGVNGTGDQFNWIFFSLHLTIGRNTLTVKLFESWLHSPYWYTQTKARV